MCLLSQGHGLNATKQDQKLSYVFPIHIGTLSHTSLSLQLVLFRLIFFNRVVCFDQEMLLVRWKVKRVAATLMLDHEVFLLAINMAVTTIGDHFPSLLDEYNSRIISPIKSSLIYILKFLL